MNVGISNPRYSRPSRTFGRLIRVLALGLSLAAIRSASAQTPETGHPRLWITGADLPRLRAWASDTNPIFAGGLKQLAESARQLMDVVDTNLVPPAPDIPYGDDGAASYESFPTEQYAELFAFMSLVSVDEAVKSDYARRATNLLMYVFNQAVLGPDNSDNPAPYRNPLFYTYDRDRPRWYGEGWPLAVDWVYPYLSSADKQTIRSVFLQWAEAISTNTYAEPPTPQWVTNSPSLLVTPSTRFGAPFNPVRWSGNNYFAAHMRNLGLMSMALDDSDDAGGQLHRYLGEATGGFLYIVDDLLRTDCRGGLLPEGFEYSPQTAAYIVQFLTALHSAGQDNPAKWGPQVSFAGQPFWKDFLHAYFNSISPTPGYDSDNGIFSYYAAWYGDGQRIFAPDFIHCLGAMGIYARSVGDTNLLSELRWMEQQLPPGGADGFLSRATADVNSDGATFTDNIFYFMLFDPDAPEPSDPRPSEPLEWFAPGMQRAFSRTGWTTNDAWITFKLGWSHVDHQLADGNQFEFFRKGEWLTREFTGYDLDAGSSDLHNTLALENDLPSLDSTNDPRYLLYLRGSQWGLLSAGDPVVVSHSFDPQFVQITGDSTQLYNTTYQGATDISHASRSLVWLKPDTFVVYDRAESKTSGRFKRFWLNTATQASISGGRASVAMPSGQQLFSTTLLPANALIASEAYVELPSGAYGIYGFQPDNQPMQYRLRVEAPGGPASTRFLHVIEGADAGAPAASATLVRSSQGSAFEGAQVGGSVVMFPITLYSALTNMTYTSLSPAALHLITGLATNAGYTVTRSPSGGGETVTISAGGSAMTDAGGNLVLSSASNPTVSISSGAGGAWAIYIDGVPSGASVAIQSSVNLKDWTTLGSASAAAGGRWKFDVAPGAPVQFFRALVN